MNPMHATSPPLSAAPQARRLADQAYATLKSWLFAFSLMPGDRLSETELASKLAVSRTPLREALHRLQHEGLVQTLPKAGWIVAPLDFARIDQLYDFRILIERHAVSRLCALGGAGLPVEIDALEAIWACAPGDRQTDPRVVGELDEGFHASLVATLRNDEILKSHREITDRIRIVRRLDFTQPERVAATYDEHARVLSAVRAGRADLAEGLIGAHIEHSKREVRKITLEMLDRARVRSFPSPRS